MAIQRRSGGKVLPFVLDLKAAKGDLNDGPSAPQVNDEYGGLLVLV